MQEIPPMMRPFVLAAAISLALAACNGQAPEAGTPAATDQPTAEADVTPAAAENPLLTASPLPFQAPPFDKNAARKSVVSGTGVSVRVDLVGRRSSKTKTR